MFHGGGCGDLLCSVAVNRKKILLNAAIVHTFRRTSCHDQILLSYQSVFDALLHIASAMPVRVRFIHRALFKVVPSEYLLGPQLEGIQQLQVRSICQGQLPFAKLHEAIHSLVVIPDTGVCDQIVDPVHLHRDFPADGNFAPQHGLPETAVVFWRSRIRECHWLMLLSDFPDHPPMPIKIHRL